MFQGRTSHKFFDAGENPIMHIYYTSRPVLFGMCAGNEICTGDGYCLEVLTCVLDSECAGHEVCSPQQRCEDPCNTSACAMSVSFLPSSSEAASTHTRCLTATAAAVLSARTKSVTGRRRASYFE